MRKARRGILIAATLVAAALVGWVCLNPPGRFGLCFFGLTTYNCLPRPLSDMQVRSDGKTRTVDKTHDLRLTRVQWLLDAKPEVLIIAIGWHGAVDVDGKIEAFPGCEVRMLKTPQALRLYNQLKREGRKVAIHVHSTC